MSRFDRVLLAVVVGLGLAIAVLSVASARLGPRVDSLAMASTVGGTSVNTQISLTFTAHMDRGSVERAFYLQPRTAGAFSWTGNELFFTPRRPLLYHTRYRLTVEASAHDTSGHHLAHTYGIAFTTQPEHLVILGRGTDQGRLILASVDGDRQTLGPNTDRVTDDAVSSDGALLAYTRRSCATCRANELWVLSLADASTQRIFTHPDWSLSQPHFSPDGRFIVFLATNVLICDRYYGCNRDTTRPVIEILDLRSHRVRPFGARSDVPLTNFIQFSPSGQLAYTDLGSALTLASPDGKQIVHVPARGNSVEFQGFDRKGDKAVFVGQTPSSSGGDILVYQASRYVDISRGVYDSSTPAFASSGAAIAYAAYRGELQVEPIYGINVYRFATHRTARLTAERRWSDWSPRWSSDDLYIAFVRSQPQEAMYMGAGTIWVMRSDGTDAHSLGETGTNPIWVP